MRRDPIDPEVLSEISVCVKTLAEGGLIAYPSDSLWGLGCDATNAAAISRLMDIKKRPEEKSFITLVSSERMLQQVVAVIPDMAWDLIDMSTEPLTLIYPKANAPYQHLTGANGKIAVRLVEQGFCHQLLTRYNKPLISTSANFSGQPTPLNKSDISSEIVGHMDYVVGIDDPDMSGKPSHIIEVETDGRIRIIRR